MPAFVKNGFEKLVAKHRIVLFVRRAFSLITLKMILMQIEIMQSNLAQKYISVKNVWKIADSNKFKIKLSLKRSYTFTVMLEENVSIVSFMLTIIVKHLLDKQWQIVYMNISRIYA